MRPLQLLALQPLITLGTACARHSLLCLQDFFRQVVTPSYTNVFRDREGIVGASSMGAMWRQRVCVV